MQRSFTICRKDVYYFYKGYTYVMRNLRKKLLNMKFIGFVKNLIKNSKESLKIYKLKQNNQLMKKLKEMLWENDVNILIFNLFKNI